MSAESSPSCRPRQAYVKWDKSSIVRGYGLHALKFFNISYRIINHGSVIVTSGPEMRAALMIIAVTGESRAHMLAFSVHEHAAYHLHGGATNFNRRPNKLVFRKANLTGGCSLLGPIFATVVR